MTKARRTVLWLLVVAALVVVGGLWWWFTKTKSDTGRQPTTTSSQHTDHAAAKNDKKPTIDCGSKRLFAGESFGAQFCYPTSWGDASVVDAKLSVDDTGQRQTITFSAAPFFRVGGVSDDYTTSVARDGVCVDPSNQVPPLSSYSTEWHDQIGSGTDLEYAIRALPTSGGGYAITEEVSSLLSSGVCGRGYKVIDSSRYRVLSASYYREFAPAAGIATPAQHVAQPNNLFSAEQRQQFDELLTSARSY